MGWYCPELCRIIRAIFPLREEALDEGSFDR